MVKTLITNKVTAIFTITLGKPIAYAMHALPTAVSRIIYLKILINVMNAAFFHKFWFYQEPKLIKYEHTLSGKNLFFW
jgi:hypothetical protein